MCELAQALAAYQSTGYVVAPAGYGKTHLIAQATALSEHRQLVLTHTYAGVNALRRKMGSLGVKEKQFHIDTIASWALRLCLSYAETSGWNIDRPTDNQQWSAVYAACADLLDQAFARRIVRASYAGMYVDEYQDCSEAQHALVLKLARDLPCRILGDPLQGIFDFGGQQAVDWERDIEAPLERLGTLETPHRWLQADAPDLAEWLRQMRGRLESGQAVDLGQRLPQGLQYIAANAAPQELLQVQGNTCRYFDCDAEQSVIAIHKGSQEYKAKCHNLSKRLSGRYSSIEEVEGRELFSFLRRLAAAASTNAKLAEALGFAAKCMTQVNANLPAAMIRGEAVTIRANTRNPHIAVLTNEFLQHPTSARMLAILQSIKLLPETNVVRADLLNRGLGVFQKHTMHPELSLDEAAARYQREFRYKGRPVGHKKQIGTTLLVKGLEYDHAIVLDATTLTRKELYVALTRGARSLTVISTNPILNPPA